MDRLAHRDQVGPGVRLRPAPRRLLARPVQARTVQARTVQARTVQASTMPGRPRMAAPVAVCCAVLGVQ